MLEEKKIIDKIEIINDIIHVRERNAILKDGIEIAYTFHRFTLSIQDSLDGQDPKIIAIANAIWPNLTNTQISGTL